MAIRAPDGAKKMLVLLVRKLGIYTKELGNYAGYWLRKVNLKNLNFRGIQISRNAVTHVQGHFKIFKIVVHLLCYLIALVEERFLTNCY